MIDLFHTYHNDHTLLLSSHINDKPSFAIMPSLDTGDTHIPAINQGASIVFTLLIRSAKLFNMSCLKLLTHCPLLLCDQVSFKAVVTFNMDEYVFGDVTSASRPCAKNPNVIFCYLSELRITFCPKTDVLHCV